MRSSLNFLFDRNYQIVFCYSIIETNNRYSLPESFAINDSYYQHSPVIPSDILYSYFPFDPFVLKRSSIFIRPIYNDYRDENDEFTTKDSDHNDVSNHHPAFPHRRVHCLLGRRYRR
jgi:hypothetical protein